MEKHDEFYSAGEARGYISLDQAVLKALQLARRDEGRYKQSARWDQIAWGEENSEQRDDFYRVVLKFWNPRPPRAYDLLLLAQGQGRLEYVFGLIGELLGSQVLQWPEGADPGASAPQDQSESVMPDPAAIVSAQKRIEALRAELKPLSAISREGAQFFMDQFVLERGEKVLIGISITEESRFLGI